MSYGGGEMVDFEITRIYSQVSKSGGKLGINNMVFSLDGEMRD